MALTTDAAGSPTEVGAAGDIASNARDNRGSHAVSQVRPTVIVPLSPERYRVQLTITRETHDKLRRVQDLMGHTLPNSDAAVIFDRALTLLLNELEKRTLARTSAPRPLRRARRRSRHVPAPVRREVWARDGGRCTFVGTDGRCGARRLLELHHVVPYADGGATDATNLTLRCRAHNQYDADLQFGSLTVREAPATYAGDLRTPSGSS